MVEHDLSTTEGGRNYLIELFAEVIERNDFREYIEERLAGDLARWLQRTGSSPKL